MKQIIKKILPFLPITLVVLLSIFVATATYKPGTILSGWDTLHPEFNLKLYFNRVFWGAWQEHQGLGAASAQAHLAELPRIPIIWVLQTLFDKTLVRYIFILSMYVLGGISTYWYIQYVWFQNKKEYYYTLAASLGSLLYLFNLGTLQQFHVPLEMFAVHFATFGLVLGSIHLFITRGDKKFAIMLLVMQLLAAPSAHTATLFYVYTLLLFGYGFLLVLLDKKTFKIQIKRFFIMILLVISANAFWMGPNIYYIINNSQKIQEAKINRNFSDEAFWQNQAYGEIKNVVTLKNFLFNWKVYDFETHEFADMFAIWDKHLPNIEKYWQSTLAIIFIVGILYSFKTKKKEKLPLLLILLTGFLFLNNLNQPSFKLYEFLLSLSNTLKEALRFPFTKFSIIFMFALSVYFAEFCTLIFKKIAKITNQALHYPLSAVFILFVSILILHPTKPMLTGGLISDEVKVKIPAEYFELFDWFKTQDESERIALFPIIDFWPWTYYDWGKDTLASGYQGGGFLWFGLPQPLLNREFDRWAPQNEYFFHEMNAALLKKDSKQFMQTLQKYDVSWLIYDAHMFDPQDVKRSKTSDIESDTQVQAKTFNDFVNNNDDISLYKTFGGITVYQVENNNVATTTAQKVGSQQQKVVKDIVYETSGDYISDSEFDSNYLFANLYDEQNSNLIKNMNGELQIQNELNKYDNLELPNWRDTSSSLPVQIYGTLDENNNLEIMVESILPNFETTNNIYNFSDFASAKSLSTAKQQLFEDNYYQVYIGKEVEVLEPQINQVQNLGIAYITSKENLEIRIEASYSHESQTIVIAKEDLQLLFPNQITVPLSDSDKVTITYQEPILSKIVKKMSPSQSYFEQNCFEKGTVNFIDEQNSRIFTAFDGGIACQGFLLNNLPKSDGYLVTLALKNISGPGVYVQSNEMGKTKIFLQETPNIHDIYNNYSLFPSNNNDLSFVIVNRSFGAYKAINQLDSLELLPIPFEFFGKIVAKKDVQPANTNTVTISQRLKPKVGEWYSIIINDQINTSIILLEQSFDTGWLAVSLEKPFTQLPHYIHNSWANAWEVSTQERYIVIFFWPQLLVWFGFGLLFITTFFIARYTTKRIKRNKRLDWKKIRAIFYEKKEHI